jgi:hypothetical protein
MLLALGVFVAFAAVGICVHALGVIAAALFQ